MTNIFAEIEREAEQGLAQQALSAVAPGPAMAAPSAAGRNIFAQIEAEEDGGLVHSLKDAAFQAAGPGFNKGLDAILRTPGEIAGLAMDKLGFDGNRVRIGAVPGRDNALDKLSAWLNKGAEQFPPETTAGRYGQSVGQAAGAAALPMAGMLAAAPRVAAAIPATAPSTAAQTVRSMADAIAQAPGAAVAADAVANVGSGIARQGAEDAGYGPTGQAIAAIVGGLAPIGVSATLPTRQLATQRAAAIDADRAAHAELGVRPFGPAFSQGPQASIAKQLTETAYIGAPLKNALDESLTGARDAVRRVADRMGPEVAYDQAGLNLQRGLDRYRGARIAEVEPDALAQLGVQPSHSVPTNRMMSAEALARSNQADAIRVAQGQPPQPINSVTVQRRTGGDLSGAEVAAITRAPSHQTSFAAKGEALYERAWNMIPPMLRADGSVNPNRLAAVNTRQVMGQVQDEIANQIAGQGRITGDLADRLVNARAHFSLQDLRAIRTEVGRALGNFGLGDVRLDRTQLNQIYGALSRDIEVGIRDLANRARIGSQRPPGSPDYVSPDVAERAEAAFHAMRRADQYTRAGMARVDRFMKVLRVDHPEAAARTLVNAGLDAAKGNLQLVRAARSVLRPDEWREFSGLMLREMGKPVASARGTVQEIGFSVTSFLTRWQAMSPQARSLFFGGEHEAAIDSLVRVISRLANVEALANTSRSTTNVINMGGAMSVAGMALSGQIPQAVGILGSGYAASILLSRPAYANWAAGYARARAAALRSPIIADRMMARQMALLKAMAEADPALIPVYQAASAENQSSSQTSH